MTTDDRSRMNRARFEKAAANYFSPALSFFDGLGEKLITQLDIRAGASVLDVGCGTAALTLPAAEAVGPTGRVVGSDISPGMLQVARGRSEEAGHHWTSYVEADIASLNPVELFDYGVCGFVMQMFNDLTTVPRALAENVRPGGKVGVSVWGKGLWEPHSTIFNSIVGGLRPDLLPKPGNIEKLQEPGVLESMMQDGGLEQVEVFEVDHPHVLPTYDEYWNMVNTLGGRVVLEKMTEDEATELNARLEPAIQNASNPDGSLTLNMATLFAVGVVGDSA